MDSYINLLNADIQNKIWILLNNKELLSINNIVKINYRTLINLYYNKLYKMIEKVRDIDILFKRYSYKYLYHEIISFELLYHDNCENVYDEHLCSVCLMDINININNLDEISINNLSDIFREIIYAYKFYMQFPVLHKLLNIGNILTYLKYQHLYNALNFEYVEYIHNYPREAIVTQLRYLTNIDIQTLEFKNSKDESISIYYEDLETDNNFIDLTLDETYQLFVRLCIMLIIDINLKLNNNIKKKYEDLSMFYDCLFNQINYIESVDAHKLYNFDIFKYISTSVSNFI
jgi:hypothetical protein